MSDQKQMKKITIENLEKAERKIATGKLRKLGFGAVILAVLAVGGYGAFRLMSGEVVASRFVVSQMVCPACVVTVKEVTSKLPGVVETDISLAAQDVTVKFREKKITPEQIREAIVAAGYPTKVEGVFNTDGSPKKDKIVALVNGKPVFEKEVSLPFSVEKQSAEKSSPASAFFSTIGKEILLQVADSKTIIVQPQEIEIEFEKAVKDSGLSKDQFVKKVEADYGSHEKYFQMVGQQLGLKKLVDEHIAENVKNPEEKNKRVLEWMGTVFRDADVKITDSSFKEKIHAASGQDDWKTFWPRMISSNSELKTILVQ